MPFTCLGCASWVALLTFLASSLVWFVYGVVLLTGLGVFTGCVEYLLVLLTWFALVTCFVLSAGLCCLRVWFCLMVLCCVLALRFYWFVSFTGLVGLLLCVVYWFVVFTVLFSCSGV